MHLILYRLTFLKIYSLINPQTARFLFSQHLMFFKNCNPTGYELNFDIKQFLFFFFLIFFYPLLSSKLVGVVRTRTARASAAVARVEFFFFQKRKKEGRTKIEKTAHCLT